MAWVHQHQRAAGVGLTVSALALFGIAVLIGWAIVTGLPPTAGVGPSTEPSASATPSAAARATPTSEPTATTVPTPAFMAPDDILPPRSRAAVTLDGLRVREQPGLNAAVVDTLPAGTVIDVTGWWGPIVVDGIDWYSVFYDGRRKSGYAAAGSDGNRYLELLPPRCEDGEPDLAALLRITEWEQLACFGDRSLTVTGTYGCLVCGSYMPGRYEPMWLAFPGLLSYLGSSPDAVLTLHFPPEAGLESPPNASIVRVTGHFNDPTSTTCVVEAPGEPVVSVDPAIAELYCREQFVVDAYEIIGTDPDFAYPPAP
jgi:hypothetical protein